MNHKLIAPALTLALGAFGATESRAQLFQTPLQFFTDLQTTGVAVGDVNSDGHRDVVVTACTCGPLTPKIYIYYGRADGTLNPTAFVYFPQASGGSVSIGDVTGDGRPDIVTHGGGVEVIPQNAAGGLEPSIRYPSNFSEATRIGDLNGDGRLDAIGLEFSVDGHINTEEAGIFYQNPAGSFDAQVLVPLPHGFNDDLELADVNGDGRLDVVNVNAFNHPAIVILYQTAGGTLSAPVTLDVGPSVLNQLAVGDLNGDGRKDLAVTYGGWLTDAHVAIFSQQADGSFAAPVSFDTSGEMTALEIGDANGDGRQDLLLLHRISISVWLQAGGALGPETSIAIPAAGGHYQHGFVATDINGDGALDLAYSQVGAQGALTVLYGNAPPPPPPPSDNHKPVANPDFADTQDDNAAVIAVLDNDSDPDGDALSLAGVTKPSNGKATIIGKEIRYVPRQGFHGTDEFLYLVVDGRGGKAPGVVTVTVR